MSLLIVFAVAVRALRRNAMRTSLTALGMIIGVAAVIVMVAIGNGARASIEAQIRSAGSNVVIVSAGSTGFGPVRQGQGATTTLTVADAMAIREEVAGIRYLSPGVNTRAQVVAEASNWGTQVQGAGAELAAVRAWPLELGVFLSEADVARAANVAVLGAVVRDELFGAGADPTGAIARSLVATAIGGFFTGMSPRHERRVLGSSCGSAVRAQWRSCASATRRFASSAC